MFWYLVLLGSFLRVGKGNHLAPLFPVQRTAVSVPGPPVCLAFPLPCSLLPYLCEKGVTVKAERTY